MSSTRKALELDPFNAAAHFDQGQLMLGLSRPDAARSHFVRVYEIALASSYAEQLRDQGVPEPKPALATLRLPNMAQATGGNLAIADSAASSLPSLGDSNTQAVAYEIQTFDGADDSALRIKQLEAEVLAPVNRLRVFFETGLLYNTNVTLTPVSRELAQSDSASFQAFANPDLAWRWIQTDSTRIGPLFRGYFTANESQFQEFNLASFQPGVFAEREFNLGKSEAIGRLGYVYANDLFDGEQVADRHSGTASLTVIRPDLDAIYGYLTLAQSNFADDGVDPSQSSLDGTAITTGISRFFQTGWSRVPMHLLGVDLEYANTDGDDFRFLSYNLHGSAGWDISFTYTR